MQIETTPSMKSMKTKPLAIPLRFRQMTDKKLRLPRALPVALILLLTMLSACAPGEAPPAAICDTYDRALFTTHLDKDYDLIDCLSFAMMDAFGVREAFGFDRHFIQHGYRLVPD